MEQNQHQPDGYRCTGDCLSCSKEQRQYCAAQFTYNNMRLIESMQVSINAMQVTMDELKVKLDAIQGDEASIFDPLSPPACDVTMASPLTSPTAQNGDGA